MNVFRIMFVIVTLTLVFSLSGFLLLGLGTHSEGLLYFMGNVLMPGVFVAGLVAPTLTKGFFWFTVMIIQLFYYTGIISIFWLIRKRVMKTREQA